MRTLLLTLPALAAATFTTSGSTTAIPSGVLPDTGDRTRLLVVEGMAIADAPDPIPGHAALACPMPVHVPSRLAILPDSLPGRSTIRTGSRSPTNVSGMPIARSGCYNPLFTPRAPAPPDTAAPR
jgi:hypothetical protein